METLPKRGYRFVAAVRPPENVEQEGEESLAAAPPRNSEIKNQTTPTARAQDTPEEAYSAPLASGPAALTPQAPSPEPARNLAAHAPVGWGVWALVAVVLAVALWRRVSTTPRPLHSLAVLPFANLSGDPSQDYFADAMTEELTSDLGNITALRVISRTSSMHFKKSTSTVPKIARELGVDGIVEGSVVRSGNQVRITAQLIDAPSDRHLWAESYNRDLKDVLALQSEIARTIATKIEAAVTPEEEKRLQPGTVNADAYEAYVRGRAYLDKWTEGDNLLALHSFEQATEFDPKYSLAYVGIAESYLIGVSGVSQQEGIRRGFAAINQALTLKPEMGEARAILGQLKLERDWDFVGAEAEFRRGIALNPSYAPAHHWYSHLLIDLGRFDESLTETRKLMDLDPASSTAGGHLAFHYRAERQWDLAIAQYQKVLAMNPEDADQHWQLGESYVGKGMYRDAIAELRHSVEMARGRAEYPKYLASLGYALARSGDVADARKIVAELPADSLMELAYVYAGLGDHTKSIDMLNQAYQQHTFTLEANYIVELDPLRADPQFIAVLHHVGLR